MNPFESALGRRCLKLLHKNPRLYAATKRMARLRGFLPPIVIPGIPGRVHRNDLMALDRTDYAKTSKEHFEILADELAFAGKEWGDVGSFIDFGCGYGRVTRWLPTVVPPEKVTACDVEVEAVRWCEREFGVVGLIGTPQITGTRFETYDALFACSVLTHLSARMIDVYLGTLVGILNPGGVAVFTGKSITSAQTARQTSVHLENETVKAALNDKGFYFLAYPHYGNPDLGDTFFTQDWLAERLPAKLSLLRHRTAQFWSHDSYVIRRNA